MFADAGYAGTLIGGAKEKTNLTLAIGKRVPALPRLKPPATMLRRIA